MNQLAKPNHYWPSASFFDDFLTRDLFGGNDWRDGGTVPRVNIIETDDNFAVEMAAPGMKKSDFQIALDNNLLTIESERAASSEHERHFTRREFGYQSFRRSFYLPNTVEREKIKAMYKDGILSLYIPKKEEAKRKPVKTIAIT